MKVSLGTTAIYIYILYAIVVHSQEKQEQFRRFEILVTGLRHTNYLLEGTTVCCTESLSAAACSTPCYRSPSIIINGMPAITFPSIGNNVPPVDGDFVYNNVWENNDEPRVFLDLLNVSISIVRTEDSRSLGTGFLERLRFAPNTDRQWRDFSLGDNIKVNIHISYWCHSYTGMNCQYPCDEDDPNIECDYKTGAIFCKNGNPNPQDCSISSDACITNNCQNNGICHMTYPGFTYCECSTGFVGKNCEFPVCTAPCDPDFGNCVNGHCVCSTGWEGENCSTATCNGWNMCQNNGECIIKFNDHVCSCNPAIYSGQFCEKSCPINCIFGTCYFDGTTSSCVCYEGYTGVGCSEITPPKPPIFESGYVPKYKQTAIIVGVVIALIIIAIFTFGLGSYLRKNITRNMKVVKRAQFVVNTLKREAMLDPTLNPTLMDPTAGVNN